MNYETMETGQQKAIAYVKYIHLRARKFVKNPQTLYSGMHELQDLGK